MSLDYPTELKASDWTSKKGRTAPGAELTDELKKLEKCYGELRKGATEMKYAALSAQATGVAAVARRTHDRCLGPIHGATRTVCLTIAKDAREFKAKVDAALEVHEAYLDKQEAVLDAMVRSLAKLEKETKATLLKANRFVETAKRGPGNDSRKKSLAATFVNQFDGHLATAKKISDKFPLISSSHRSTNAKYEGDSKEATRLHKEIVSLSNEGKKAVKAFV